MTKTKSECHRTAPGWRRGWKNTAGMFCLAGLAALAGDRPPAGQDDGPATTTPIKHLIVVVGENHTFDNVFGGYAPRNGQTVLNLLSQGIINPDGTPGKNVSKAAQMMASDTDTYQATPSRTGPYAQIDQPNTTYALGQSQNDPDKRFPISLPNAPFPLSKYVPYAGAFTGDPVHRFFQMWQEYDGGRMDLFQWVGETVGTGPQNTAPAPTPGNTYQGGVAMGFWNMSRGDAPYLRFMADNYAISDNYHQGIMGGTGANFIYLGTGDVGFFSDGNGHPQVPFANQIENPNPDAGTNNFYKQDGYAGGSYVNCSDPAQPGVGDIRNGPGYKPDGTPNPPAGASDFRLPPQTLPTIADALSAKGVSWKYYIGGWNGGNPDANWCSICNPLAADITTRGTSWPWTSSATARAFRSS